MITYQKNSQELGNTDFSNFHYALDCWNINKKTITGKWSNRTSVTDNIILITFTTQNKKTEFLLRTYTTMRTETFPPHSSSSSVTNWPVPGFNAAKKKNATLNNTSGSISLIGTPVSMFSCPSAPFPVMISPIRENAIPNCANLPTKSSFDFVNPNRGPFWSKDYHHNIILSSLKWTINWRVKVNRNTNKCFTSFFETKSRPEAFSRRNDSLIESSGRSRIIHKAATVTQSSNRAEKSEEDEEEQQRLSFIDWDPSFQIQLSKDSFPCYSFSKQRRLQTFLPNDQTKAKDWIFFIKIIINTHSKANHGNAANKELILLSETNPSWSAKDTIFHF